LLHELVQVVVQADPYSTWGQQPGNSYTSKKVLHCRFTIVTPWKTQFASSPQKQFYFYFFLYKPLISAQRF